ncbi:MAG: type secretion system protein [Herminiimonas sp.]|nr:type secretion system protein [Herminiimonas sp.]
MRFDFEWPLPPHFELIPKSGLSRMTGQSLIVMNDGRREPGTLQRLDPETSLAEFTPDKASTNLSIGFSKFKSIRLLDPIGLSRVKLTTGAEGADSGLGKTPLKQKCVVYFKDGDSLISETIGFVQQKCGLFLFLVSDGSTVLRWFIPSDAIKSFQIGTQLGEILVDENLVSQDSVDEGLKQQEALRTKKLGDYLQHQQIVTQAQIEQALQNQKEMPHIRLGEALLQEKLITEDQLNEALELQSRDRKMHLGEILVTMEVVKRETIRRVLAQKLGIPLVSLRKFEFDPNLIKTVPAELVRKHNVMPLYRTDARLVVAMENPLEFEALQALAFFTKLKIDPVMSSADDIGTAIKRFYGSQSARESMEDLVGELGSGYDALPNVGGPVLEDVSESDNTLVRLVNKIILDAFEDGASDIHIETMKGNKPTRVRFRKDGVMTHYSEIPANFRNALVSRLKIMSRLDISEKRRSQDGKLDFQQFGPAKIELRVLTMPTTEGLEDVVMRILAAPKAISIENLGLSSYALEGVKKIAGSPHGLLFVCGPTGSGKTTTLHSMLNYINTPQRKIWTVEDPIEITQEGLRQVQVQTKIDWTFAAVLRSFLRADPDVIMVGETRDPETAKTVIEASLTGHLVFSTMHTNSAAESVVRLLDLGLDPFNFADALKGVVGQRLARRLCTTCCQSYQPDNEELNMLAHEYCFETELEPSDVIAQWKKAHGNGDGKLTLQRANGCDECNGSGYKGRVGVHELLINSAAVKRKIHAKATVQEIVKVAVSEGMQTLRQDGINKIFQGYTDWEQIRTL